MSLEKYRDNGVGSHPNWNKIIVTKKIPQRLEHLETIARNLWWSWNQEAIELFKLVDKALWKESESNPILMLDQLTLKRYKELESDQKFLRKLDLVYDNFAHYMAKKSDDQMAKIAYFSMEYGLDRSLKIYSGGLGVLAGDFLKEASDMMVPITAVGLLYKYGYFTQRLSSSGEQISIYEPQDFRAIPVSPVRATDGSWMTISVPISTHEVKARIWRCDVGRRELYLLDTDFEENSPEDRAITHHLYGGDWENRLKQEILLGIGGIKVLRALDKETDVYHLNEGHAAFTTIERLRELIAERGLSFEESLEVVKSSSLFTTHTPVPAGHDMFEHELIRKYLPSIPQSLNLSWDQFLSLGRVRPENTEEKFSMSNLAAHLSMEINGVSMLHGKVSRDILAPLWPGYLPQELHINYVTNGVHYPTWTAPEWKELHAEVFGEDFLNHHYDKECFKGIYDVEASTIWYVRNKLRARLIKTVKHSFSVHSTTEHYTPQQIVEITENLRDDVLTIGFARRFATYKRAHLLFNDLERLDKVVNNPSMPVQFLFAGKAHPADKAGQDLIKRIVEVSVMPQFIGKILFVPGYDMTLAKHFVQGCDVWMNTPTRPLEASGTSGQKAAMNGVMHFSVLDGWWVEGYKEGAGWALPQERSYENQEYQNQLDAATIYKILENEIIPLFYNRHSSRDSLPMGWIDTIKNTIAHVASNFTTNRMMSDYIERFYIKLGLAHSKMVENNFELASEIARWKEKMREEWSAIKVLEYTRPDYQKSDIILGEPYNAEVLLSIGELSPNDIGVEMLIAENGSEKITGEIKQLDFNLVEYKHGLARYRCQVLVETAGAFNLAARVYPKNEKLAHRLDFDIVKWL